ncbi:sigma-70 family RNA polymerase sigma factor [Flagellimonas olearia]|uniref:Uncharacterized protein n=1 Tax=Flagellimonas olearia TaxID=552546 RepID=A0A444VM15_9FLAO|nr:sigma-70 family RNA polymerase sigma factor [Allomuricauda olearia]RYC51752.1 hypothetical protein DN53_13065 [Allomuricauda olearia]
MQDVGKYLEGNSKKLDHISNVEWEIALRKCRDHLRFRLRGRTKQGAHSTEYLEVPAHEYYLAFAYNGIIFGQWEWKDEYTLDQQLIRIIDSRISTVVQSYKSVLAKNARKVEEGKIPDIVSLEPKNVEESFYDLEDHPPPNEDELMQIEKEYGLIEEFMMNSDDDYLKIFWECAKEGLKRNETAEIMGIKPKQLDKVREKFLRQLRKMDGDEKG